MKKKLFHLFFIFFSLFYTSYMCTEMYNYTYKKAGAIYSPSKINPINVILGLGVAGAVSWFIKEAYDYYSLKKKIRKIIVKKENVLCLREVVKDKFYLFILYKDYLFERKISKKPVPAFFNDKDFIIKNQAYSKEFLRIKSDVYGLLYRVIDILSKDDDFRKIVLRSKNKLFFRPLLEEVIFEIFLERDFFSHFLSYLSEYETDLDVHDK